MTTTMKTDCGREIDETFFDPMSGDRIETGFVVLCARPRLEGKELCERCLEEVGEES